jgi:ssDNA-specific exonuclease RecJ
VDAPKDANIVQSRYVFCYKHDTAGNIIKYKAQLIAKGYTQVHGIDYYETFALVVKHTSLRTLLSMAAQHNSIVHQADIKNAYLNAELKETIYMELPPQYSHFRTLTETTKTFRCPICKLKKSLYGTKQGAREWYQKVRQMFKKLGYDASTADEAVFYIIKGDEYTIVASATDDFTIITDSLNTVRTIKNQLNDEFELVEFGEISWLLSINIIRDLNARMISLGQQAYTNHIFIRMKLSVRATLEV